MLSGLMPVIRASHTTSVRKESLINEDIEAVTMVEAMKIEA